MRKGLPLLIVALLGGCSIGGADHAADSRIFELATYMHPDEFEATSLRRVDAETLLPVGRPLRLGDAVSSRVVSPDRSTVAFGGWNFGEIILVDPKTMRRSTLRVTRERSRSVDVVSWPRRRTLVATSCRDAGKWGCFDQRLWLIDPEHPRARRSIRVPAGAVTAFDSGTRRTLVLVSGFGGGIRPSRLLVVEPGGRVRRLSLTRIRAGVDARRRFGAHYVGTGLAVDSRRAVAIVAGPRAPVAEIDLRTLRVRYHLVRGLDPPERELARDHPREWTGTANPHSTSYRDVTAIGAGRFLVRISESRLMPGWRVRELSRNVVLDSAAWRVRTPPGSTRGWLAPSGDVMLVNARPGGHKAFPPFRLLAYDRDGSVRYRLDGRRDRLFTWLVGDGLLYAGTRSGEMTHIFELGTGKLLRKVPPRELAFDLQPAAFRWTPPD